MFLHSLNPITLTPISPTLTHIDIHTHMLNDAIPTDHMSYGYSVLSFVTLTLADNTPKHRLKTNVDSESMR